ncbi:hypothetical protein EON65_49210 [archaeon]|nr:MAG: hypothetical protein EON65_49210 [archaeon]
MLDLIFGGEGKKDQKIAKQGDTQNAADLHQPDAPHMATNRTTCHNYRHNAYLSWFTCLWCKEAGTQVQAPVVSSAILSRFVVALRPSLPLLLHFSTHSIYGTRCLQTSVNKSCLRSHICSLAVALWGREIKRKHDEDPIVEPCPFSACAQRGKCEISFKISFLRITTFRTPRCSILLLP